MAREEKDSSQRAHEAGEPDASWEPLRPKAFDEKEVRLFEHVRSLWRPDSQAYEDSYGYLIQATRFGQILGRYYEQETNSLVYFGQKTAADPTLVVPTAFATPKDLARIVRATEHTVREYGLPVSKTVLKNIDPQEQEAYERYGFRGGSVYFWYSPRDDQQYPQTIVDLETIVKKREGGTYRQLRHALNRVEDRYTIRPFEEADTDTVLELMAKKDGIIGIKNAVAYAKAYIAARMQGSLEEQRHSESVLDAISEEYFFSHIMYVAPSSAVERYVVEEEDQIIGFTATSPISKSTTALCAGIFAEEIPDLTAWGLYKTMEIKRQQGYTHANLGGSERRSLYKFKRRLFPPVKELHRTHLVFDPPSS